MKTRCSFAPAGLIILAFLYLCAQTIEAEKYEATWESLGAKDDAPEWLKDAKFGIYTHWGPQTLFGNVEIVGSVAYYTRLRPARVDFGSFNVEKTGACKLQVKTKRTNGAWSPFEVYGISLKQVAR